MLTAVAEEVEGRAHTAQERFQGYYWGGEVGLCLTTMTPSGFPSLPSDLCRSPVCSLLASAHLGNRCNHNNKHLSLRVVGYILHVQDLIGLILVARWLVTN